MIKKLIKFIKRKLYPSKVTNIKNMILANEQENKQGKDNA